MSSSDKFTGPAVYVGDKITLVNGDESWTQTIDSLSYQSGGVIYKQLTRWESFVRRITPKRWRQPIPVTHELPVMTINCDDPLWRMEKAVKSVIDGCEALLDG